MITGSTYLLRGQPVTVLAAWNGARNPGLDRLQSTLPLVRLKATAPRNVLIRRANGVTQVRPFRGLRTVPDTQESPS